jgi:hypothetical protein
MMLWYKSWLEVRWRFVFMVGSILLVWLSPMWITATGVQPGAAAARQWMSIQLGSVLMYIITAIFLAGSGVNSQTLYAATTGFHGSMFFTLSLPVSRRRLLFARAGLGFLLTFFLAIAMVGYLLHLRPETTSTLQALLYLARVITCTLPIYALAVLLACVLDEMWQFMGACIIWVAVFFLQSKFDWIARISPLRGLSLNCYPITAPMPWAPVVASLMLTGVFVWMAVAFLQRKEY